MSYPKELETALRAAHIAAGRVLHEYQRFIAIENAPADISTEADRLSQEILLQEIQNAFPGDALCAEETTPTLEQAKHAGDRLWIVDPIDGTRGFARKNGEFSLMIAFVEQGRIAVGVVHEPAQNRLTYAVRGAGCWRRDGADSQPTACTVTSVDELTAATLVQSRPRDPAAKTRPVRLINPSRVIETYSAGIKLAHVARGEADLYINTYDAFHDWDSCAGQILVEEAGGRVTGLNGQQLQYGLPGAWQRHGLLASNGLLHAAAVEALRGLAD